MNSQVESVAETSAEEVQVLATEVPPVVDPTLVARPWVARELRASRSAGRTGCSPS
jgi:hypothetical protein